MSYTYQPTIENNKLIIDVTAMGLFSGLYESIWLNEYSGNDDIFDITQDCNISKNDLDVSTDTVKYLHTIADAYCNFFARLLDIPTEQFHIEEVWSPSFYNYDNDHIIISWDITNVTNPLDVWNNMVHESILSLNDNIDDALKETEYYDIFDDYNGEDMYSECTIYRYVDPNSRDYFNIEFGTNPKTNAIGYYIVNDPRKIVPKVFQRAYDFDTKVEVLRSNIEDIIDEFREIFPTKNAEVKKLLAAIEDDARLYMITDGLTQFYADKYYELEIGKAITNTDIVDKLEHIQCYYNLTIEENGCKYGLHIEVNSQYKPYILSFQEV